MKHPEWLKCLGLNIFKPKGSGRGQHGKQIISQGNKGIRGTLVEQRDAIKKLISTYTFK